MAQRIAAFEKMARSMVGDGKSPNVYFVCQGGNVVCVTTNRDLADEAYEQCYGEVTLEDRKTGVLRDKGGSY